MSQLPRHGSFDPTSPARRDGKVDAASFRCPCGGAMFDVTSRLAEAMGVLHHECDKCHARTVTPVKGAAGAAGPSALRPSPSAKRTP